MPEEELFANVASTDFLKFDFRNSYEQELVLNALKTGKVAGITCKIRTLPSGQDCVFMEHEWSFSSGTLGCAEGEKLMRGFKLAQERGLPVIIKCVSGGARMQEGTLSLMQMAKVSCAVSAFKKTELPFITILADPCYGGVSASYAMQSDVRVAETRSRIGFSGERIIKTTQFDQDQAAYDRECPRQFQSAEFAFEHGQVDMVVDTDKVLGVVSNIISVLMQKKEYPWELPPFVKKPIGPAKDYTVARNVERFDCDDILRECFEDVILLGGDGKVGLDKGIRGGIALFRGSPVVVIKITKGHTERERQESGGAQPTPHGYRTALRLFEFAERFHLPIVSLVDVVGALCSFEAEICGQAEAVATNILKMAGLKVPIIALIVSEGGSGGALAVGVADRVGMMDNAYYSVISPEGAASIIGRYEGMDAHQKRSQMAKDCAKIADMQQVYSHYLLDLGVIDEIVYEYGDHHADFSATANEISKFISRSLHDLWQDENIVEKRAEKFSKMGKWQDITDEELSNRTQKPPYDVARPSAARRAPDAVPKPSQPLFLNYLVETTLSGPHSFMRNKSPINPAEKGHISIKEIPRTNFSKNAKSILDSEGPTAMAQWVREQNRVLLTDTTMRDAHQSLLATRVRTIDMLNAASTVSALMHDCFSLECWGGATFDVAYNFLREDPWERLQYLRKKIPNICFQMLLRGSSTVGYASYPDSIVRDFVKLAAKNGMDVFRIFDCFNDLRQMQVAIDAVADENKVAEVCICFTGDFLSADEKIYTLDYYGKLAREISKTRAHMVAIKDMAGLCKPGHAQPLVQVLRASLGPRIPLHFHTHNTSSSQLATLLAMTDAGMDVVDACMGSMADTTSQPSMNAFLATMENRPRDPCIPWRELEVIDNYWMRLRNIYAIFETDMRSGTASVYHHQIPGGQYSNLLMQCKEMGYMERWPEVLETYHQVNIWVGDVVKVTPSSKVVGDIALMLVKSHYTVNDIDANPDLIAAWPKSAIEMAEGTLGRPHHGFSQDMIKAILGPGAKPTYVRPGDVLEPVDLEQIRLEQNLQTLEDACSSVLYPKVFSDYQDRMRQHGPVWEMPTSHFLYGFFGVGDNFNVGSQDVTLERIKPLNYKWERVLKIKVDGFSFELGRKEAPAISSHKLASGNDQIGCPIRGKVAKILVKEGDRVKKDDPLFVVSVMKMEVTVPAPRDCAIAKVYVKENDDVVENSHLCTMV